MTRLQSVTAYTVSPKHVSFLLWTPAQRKRASMLYFANVFIYFILFIYYGRLILRPWLTEVRESFTRGGP